MKVAITGPTGSVGSDLIRCALARGDEIIAIVRPGSERLDNLPKSEHLIVLECDISNYSSLRNKAHCDVFYHLAWAKTFGTDRDDVHTQVDNIQYCIDAVDLAESWGASIFVGTGSQAEYGCTQVPLNESIPVNPTSGYGIAKFAAGKLCKLYCTQKKIRFNWARILSVYGRCDADHTLIRYLINTLLREEIPDLTDCEQIWDYVYSEDCAKALLAIGDKGVDGRTYCIGSGNPKPLKKYVEILRDAINPNLNLNFGAKPYYPHQAMFLCADISDLTADTGFVPEYPFEKGIRKMINGICNERGTK